MSKHWISVLVIVSALLAFVMACAPRVTPAPPAPAAAPAPTVAVSAPVSQPASPADAAWQQVEQAARKEGRVVAYDPTYFAGDIGRVVTKAFKDRYGVSAEFLITGGSSASIEKVRAEKRVGQSVADLMITGSVSGPNLISMGFIRKGVDKELPVLKDKSAFGLAPVYSPDGEEFIFEYSLLTAGVNKNLVKAGEIQSYRDLLDPKWKGKIVTRDPRLGSGPAMLTIVTMRLLNILDDDYFMALGRQAPVLSGAGDMEVVNMVARGEIPIAFNNPVSAVYIPLAREGAPLRILNLKEGTVVMPSVIQITNDAPHPNAAKLFINWLLSTEGQTVFHKARGSQPVRKDVSDFTPSNIDMEPVKKLLPTSWDVAIKTTEEVRSGAMEKFFGKR